MATKESIVYATPKQKEQCVSGIVSAVGDGARMALEELSSTNSLGTSQEFQEEVIFRQGELNALIRESVRESVKRKIADMVQKIIGCVKLISGGEEIIIEETDGTETLAEAADVFTGWVDGDLQKWGTNIKGKPTKKIPAQVFELAKDGNFQAIFSSFGRPLDELCWEQSQIKSFAKKHSKWLHPEGWATLLLFKVGEGAEKKFFVADVGRHDRRLGVGVYHFGYDGVWGAGYRHRIVVPQLTSVPMES